MHAKNGKRGNWRIVDDQELIERVIDKDFSWDEIGVKKEGRTPEDCRERWESIFECAEAEDESDVNSPEASENWECKRKVLVVTGANLSRLSQDELQDPTKVYGRMLELAEHVGMQQSKFPWEIYEDDFEALRKDFEHMRLLHIMIVKGVMKEMRDKSGLNSCFVGLQSNVTATCPEELSLPSGLELKISSCGSYKDVMNGNLSTFEESTRVIILTSGQTRQLSFPGDDTHMKIFLYTEDVTDGDSSSFSPILRKPGENVTSMLKRSRISIKQELEREQKRVKESRERRDGLQLVKWILRDQHRFKENWTPESKKDWMIRLGKAQTAPVMRALVQSAFSEASTKWKSMIDDLLADVPRSIPKEIEHKKEIEANDEEIKLEIESKSTNNYMHFDEKTLESRPISRESSKRKNHLEFSGMEESASSSHEHRNSIEGATERNGILMDIHRKTTKEKNHNGQIRLAERRTILSKMSEKPNPDPSLMKTIDLGEMKLSMGDLVWDIQRKNVGVVFNIKEDAKRLHSGAVSIEVGFRDEDQGYTRKQILSFLRKWRREAKPGMDPAPEMRETFEENGETYTVCAWLIEEGTTNAKKKSCRYLAIKKDMSFYDLSANELNVRMMMDEEDVGKKTPAPDKSTPLYEALQSYHAFGTNSSREDSQLVNNEDDHTTTAKDAMGSRIMQNENEEVSRNKKSESCSELDRFSAAKSNGNGKREIFPVGKPDEKFCTICRDAEVSMPWAKISNCSHLFHKDCISRYIMHQKKEGEKMECPNCRTPFEYLEEMTDVYGRYPSRKRKFRMIGFELSKRSKSDY